MVPDPHMITYPRMMALEARIRKQMKKLRELPQKRQPALTVLAFEPAPMYMLGKPDLRDTRNSPIYRWFLPGANHDVDNKQAAILRSEQETYTWRGKSDPYDGLGVRSPRTLDKYTCIPDVVESPSRPKSTYFGPGQIVVWPVIDVRKSEFRHLSASSIESWIGQLVTGCLRTLDGFRARRNIKFEPGSGIWVVSASFKEPRQIADIHIRLEDGIATFGLTLNFDVPVSGSSNVNPWGRMEEAGLSFNPATSMAWERGIWSNELQRDKEIAMRRYMDHISRTLFETMGIRVELTADPENILGDDWTSLLIDDE